MSFVLGNASRVLVNEREVSTTIAGWTASHSRAASEVTTVVESGARFVPGLMSGTLALRGPQDSVGQTLANEIRDAVGVDNAFIATVLPYGNTLGAFALTVLGDPSELAIDAAVSDAVGFAFTATADESVDMGFVVHATGPETVDGNGASVDRGVGGGTANGGVAVIHTTAYAGLTGAVIKIQHSTDNATWNDLVTFTNITAISAERKFIAAGTTVSRYVRAVTDVTGTGSVTFLVALAPR